MNSKPKCIIVTGRPGSGKTTLAKKLGGHLWMPVISRDEIKEGYVNTFGLGHGRLPADANAVVSGLFFDIVNSHLAGQVCVVIEAAFGHHVWQSKMPRIKELASPIVVLCSIDGALAAIRHLQRGLENPAREFYHGDARVSHFRHTGEVLPADDYEAPRLDVPTIEVSTDRGYSPGLDEIVRQIQAQGATGA